MRKVAIGQAGGPTAVLNASLVGFLDYLNDEVMVYGIMNGYQGLVEDDFEIIEGRMLDEIKRHKDVPGACLGSGRYMFTHDRVSQAVQHLKKRDIHSLVFIGGNGTMAALQQISIEAMAIGYELQVIGIPKTVDNDLAGTDHAPGFGSAARYVALTTRDISKDLEAMKIFEQVRIIETMGRNAGWLAAASRLLKQSEADGPHLVYIPEVPITKEQILCQVNEVVNEYGFATIVVSEGVVLKGHSQIGKGIVDGRMILGGISSEMEAFIHDELHLNARAEILGMNQRSSFLTVSTRDRFEAYEAGRKAAEFFFSGVTQIMVSIQKEEGIEYTIKLDSCPLEKVAQGGERLLPPEFISNQNLYFQWLEPLLGEPIQPYPPALKRRKVYEKQFSGYK